MHFSFVIIKKKLRTSLPQINNEHHMFFLFFLGGVGWGGARHFSSCQFRWDGFGFMNLDLRV
jgi:hypothetical protein